MSHSRQVLSRISGVCNRNAFILHKKTFTPPLFAFQNAHRCLATKVGDKASLTKTFTAEDVQSFADISLDNNPIHLDAEHAAKTKFGKPIVHGVLNLGLLGAVFGTVLPGQGSVLMGLDIKYPAPLYVGEQVTAEVEALNIKGRAATFKLTCFTDDKKVVAEGSAKILMPKEKR